VTTGEAHLRPAEERSSLTTDPMALNLFRQLREMDDRDRRFVLQQLDGSLASASSERIVLARSAMELFAAETGEALSKKRYERWRLGRSDRATLPSATFVANTWNGSWSTAMDKLGFEPAADHAARRMAMKGEPLSDGDLLEHLRECADELGGTPRVSDYHRWRRDKLRRPGSAAYAIQQTYRRRFGGWHQAIEAAGLQPRAVVPTARVAEWSVEDALGYLRDADAQSGPRRMRVSQYDDWRRQRLASVAVGGSRTAIPYGAAISSRLGGWLPALAAAGLISDRAAQSYRVGHGRSFSDTELDDALARFARETDCAPTSTAYQSWSKRTMAGDAGVHVPGRAAVCLRLGTWAAAAARIREHRLPSQEAS
jgi:Homing endonuclease associated repeat